MTFSFYLTPTEMSTAFYLTAQAKACAVINATAWHFLADPQEVPPRLILPSDAWISAKAHFMAQNIWTPGMPTAPPCYSLRLHFSCLTPSLDPAVLTSCKLDSFVRHMSMGHHVTICLSPGISGQSFLQQLAEHALTDALKRVQRPPTSQEHPGHPPWILRCWKGASRAQPAC